MDIKWSYYLIALIYILVSVLKMINVHLGMQFKKQNSDYVELLGIKRDFFTTVSCICIVVTLFINTAALYGGKSLNKASILVTLLVIGFTMINSLIKIMFSKAEESVFLLGYPLKKGEIEKIKLKERKSFTAYDITFTKEIDSYNYMKLLVFGKKRTALKEVLSEFVKESK